MSFVTILPTEVWVNVVHFIPDKDLINFFLCCRSFNDINELLNNDFWLNRGSKNLCLNLDRNILGFTAIKSKYKYIKWKFRQFIYDAEDGKVKISLYLDIMAILLLIRGTSGFLDFIKTADYFMIPWVKFIVNELKAESGVYNIRDLLLIPVPYEHVKRDNILTDIITGLSNWDHTRYNGEIELFFDIIIVSDHIQTIDITMTIMKHYHGTPQGRDGIGRFFAYKVTDMEFDKKVISERVWKHLYEWNLTNNSAVMSFINDLRLSNLTDFRHLIDFDPGMKVNEEYVFLSTEFYLM